MSHLPIETKRVKALLDEINAHPEIFDKLGNTKIEAALVAYQGNSLENLAHSINEFNKTIKLVLKRIDNKAIKVLFQEGEDASR